MPSIAVHLCAAIAAAAGCGYTCTAQVITRASLRPTTSGIAGEQNLEQSIHIGDGVDAIVLLEITAKGNGLLSVANLHIKVIDEHDDGVLFENGLLHVEFVDITGDGYKDLVIYGTVLTTGERHGDPITRDAVVSIYVFDPVKRRFELRYSQGKQLEAEASKTRSTTRTP